jgi:hypothetical protein
MVAVQDLFIRGTVLENIQGNVINNVVYDRQLRIVLQTGRVLDVFDDNYPYQPLSTHVHPHETHEFIIGLSTGTPTQYHSAAPARNHPHVGRIADLEWVPPTNPERYYRHYGPRLYHNGGGFMVIQTAEFPVLVGPDDVNVAAALNATFVSWQLFRYELLAIG